MRPVRTDSRTAAANFSSLLVSSCLSDAWIFTAIWSELKRTVFVPGMTLFGCPASAIFVRGGGSVADNGATGVDVDEGTEDAAERVLAVLMVNLATSFPVVGTCQLQGAKGTRFPWATAGAPLAVEGGGDSGGTVTLQRLTSDVPRGSQTGEGERPAELAAQTMLLPSSVVRADDSRDP